MNTYASRREFFKLASLTAGCRWTTACSIILCVLPVLLHGQLEAGTYPTRPSQIASYLPEWKSGATRDSVPDWAKPGRIRFSRWDGGPVETAKAFLSGWEGFNPPIPDYVYVMTNWYDFRTIRLLREASFNTVWVTFSVGFSIPTEERQREMVRRYIDECHRQGIHVVAYLSGTNMFWEDMYEKVPESRYWVRLDNEGKPTPYSSGVYQRMGRVTRYLADLSKPAWMDYTKKRIDLAIDAGVDGIMYDNMADPSKGPWINEVYRYATSRKKNLLIMMNHLRRDFIFNRLHNAITSEEGGEAGVFSEANVGQKGNRWNYEEPYMLRVQGGLLANNIGNFRIFQNLSEGWKPVAIESRRREAGRAEIAVMSAERQQIVLAENMMFGVANETFVEGKFAYGLWYGDPETMKIWEAIGTYNRFHAGHEEYLTDTKSLASLAVVIDNRSEPVAELNALASRNVIYDVLYEHELTPERLRPYAAVCLLGALYVRDRALRALEEYVSTGGKLLIAGKAADFDERGNPRQPPAFFSHQTGQGISVYGYQKLLPVDDLAHALLAAEQPPVVQVKAAPGVLYNYVEQPKQNRLIVHLLNYTARRTEPVTVTIRGSFAAPRLFTPDSPRAIARVISSSSPKMELEVAPLTIYSILVFDRIPGGRTRQEASMHMKRDTLFPGNDGRLGNHGLQGSMAP